MKKYLLCVTKSVNKIIGVTAKNREESRKKILKQIENDEIDFDNATKEEIEYGIGEFYSEELEKLLKKSLGEMAEEKNKKFVKLTEEIIEKNKEEQIKISCKKCGTCMLLNDIIHQ